MNWIKQIEQYTPWNEQEQKDQQSILTCVRTFDDVLTRDNEVAHITCSGFVMNKARDHVLMIHHNIYNAWGWTGGHADGETDFLQVALREVEEETGVMNLQPVTPDIISLDVLTVVGHMKKGVFISPHLHLNVSYLIEAGEDEQLTVKLDENSGVKWIPVNEIANVCNEPHMIPLYEKIISKVHQLQL